MAREKGIELSVFKGREAKLNRAILRITAQQGPQTVYDVHKQVTKTKGLGHTRYANVNLRVRALEETGYLRKSGLKLTKSGFKAVLFETTAKAYLALVLNTLSAEELFSHLDEATALTLLSSILA